MKNMSICKAFALILFITCCNLILCLKKNLSQKNLLKLDSKDIFENKDDKTVLEILKEGVSIVYFFDDKCKLCLDLSDRIKKVEKDYKNLKIVYINVDVQPELVKTLNVKKVPNISLYKDGKNVEDL